MQEMIAGNVRPAKIRRHAPLDAGADATFDRIATLAARLLKAPLAHLSFVDHDRLWLHSAALRDRRHAATPAITDQPGMRPYASAPLLAHDGHLLGTLCVLDTEPRCVTQRDIDDLADLAMIAADRIDLRLSAESALARAALMTQEVDHRVMNSLQSLSSLLVMQGRSAPENARMADQLDIAASRVAAVAHIHRHFCTDEAMDDASCLAFLKRLCADLAAVTGNTIRVEGDDALLPASRVRSIGLLTNELVTNAAKHGAGTITVTYRVDAEGHQLMVCDEGTGLPDDFDPGTITGSLGMKIVVSLVAQLKATLTAGTAPLATGACFTVSIPSLR